MLRHLLLIVTASCHFAAAQAADGTPSTPPLRIATLPVAQHFPLEGETCGCLSFRQPGALHSDAVVFSLTETRARIHVGGRNLELTHLGRRNVDRGHVNTYVGHGLSASLRTQEVPYEQACAAYADAPDHGSCFLGTLKVESAGASQSVRVIELCGC